jgi:hypothetical protein
MESSFELHLAEECHMAAMPHGFGGALVGLTIEDRL